MPVGIRYSVRTFFPVAADERDRAQGAHPLIGDPEVVDAHIQVKLLRWPLVRPAGRAVTGDLLETPAYPALPSRRART